MDTALQNYGWLGVFGLVGLAGLGASVLARAQLTRRLRQRRQREDGKSLAAHRKQLLQSINVFAVWLSSVLPPDNCPGDEKSTQHNPDVVISRARPAVKFVDGLFATAKLRQNMITRCESHTFLRMALNPLRSQ